MKKLLFIFSLILFAGSASSQQIANVDFVQEGKKIVVTYDIIGAKKGQSFNVTLWYSENSSSFSQLTSNITGDYGKITAAYDGNITGKRIVWEPLAARKQLKAKIQFEVRADISQPGGNNYTETVNGTGLDMIFVKGGTFQMGASDISYATPVHSVTLSNFYIGKYEVTNKQFCVFLNEYGSDKVKSGEFSGQIMIYDSKTYSSGNYAWGVYKSGTMWYPVSGYESFPVICVTWYGATEYCKWLSQKTGKKYRLPTEAEWEFAAGTSTGGQKWAGTNDESSLTNYAWYSSNSGSKTHQVGTKNPNGRGIYDMSSNVLEWCSDWDGTYSSSAQTNPTGASSGSRRVLRGGSWYFNASGCRVAIRFSYDPTKFGEIIGFRVVCGL